MTYAYWIVGIFVAAILLIVIFGDHMIEPIEEKDAHDPY